LRFFASCAAGTERALADELREIGVGPIKTTRGGVGFEGHYERALRVCLWSRVAVRVLLQIGELPCPDGDALYAGMRRIEWSEHIRPNQTLAVSAVSKDSALSHTMFIAQRTKDAIVDPLRERFGSRPSVDRDDPDVQVFVRVVKDVATVHLDLAGEALHRRGWREPGAEAPLKETLAAAILRLAGWDRERPLVDPCCGSGTIAIEADHWARRVAPGLARRRLGIERWASFDAPLKKTLAELREQARAAALDDGPPIFAFDADAQAVAQASRNVVRAGAHVTVRRQRVAELSPGRLGLIPSRHKPAAHVVSNPPYGERLEAGAELWPQFDELLERLPRGTRVSLLVASRPPIRLPERIERHSLMNGRIECWLVSWDVGRPRRARS
jgi:putative N6-adenine-specific DNA methylase